MNIFQLDANTTAQVWPAIKHNITPKNDDIMPCLEVPWVREDLPVPCPCWNFPCLRPHRLGFQPQVDLENRCPFWCVQGEKTYSKGFIWFIIFDYLTIWGYWYKRPFWARVSTEITRMSTYSFVSLWQASVKKWQRPCEVGNLAQLHNSLNLDAGKCWKKWNTSFVAFLIWAALRLYLPLTYVFAVSRGTFTSSY